MLPLLVRTTMAWLLVAPAAVRVTPRQGTRDRAFIDSLFVDLHAATTLDALPVARCERRSGSLGRLCQGLVLVRRAEITDSADDTRRADKAVQRVLLDLPRSAIAWYALGMARLQLARAHALAREGPLQPIGVSNEAAAGYALVRALELDSTLAYAADGLALGALPPPREGASRLGERVRMLRRVHRLLDGDALYGAGRVELEGGDADSAVVDLREALAAGASNRGIVDLSLARAEYRAGHPADGREAFIAGVADTSAESRRQYREQLSWVTSPAELAEWDSLPAARRSTWVRDFWAKRDVAEGHADGARLVEHFRRYEIALKDYRVLLPGTGRHRNVQNSDTFSDETAGAIRGAGHLGSFDRDTESSIETGASQLSAFDRDNRTMGVGRAFRFLQLSQDVLDDRGVVFMRHGKPDHVASSAAGGAAMEIWKYDLPDGPLVLQFMNQDFSSDVGASLLVPTLVTGNAVTRDAICYLETSLCPRAADSKSGRPSTLAEIRSGQMSSQRVKHAYDVGVEQIAKAATTDDFVRPFTRPMHPLVQMYGLRRGGGDSRIVVPFAIRGDELDVMPARAPGGQVSYEVRFEITAERRTDARRFALDTTRHFVTDHALRAGEFLIGTVELAVDPGIYAAAAVISQPSGRGAIARLNEMRAPVDQPGMVVSDLVLGRDGSGLQWNSGTTSVALNPLGTFPRGGMAAVYFQLAGLDAGENYHLAFSFFGAGDDSTKAPRLAIAFDQPAAQATSEISRNLDLQRLEPGRYRVVLTVAGRGGRTSATSWITITR